MNIPNKNICMYCIHEQICRYKAEVEQLVARMTKDIPDTAPSVITVNITCSSRVAKNETKDYVRIPDPMETLFR